MSPQLLGSKARVDERALLAHGAAAWCKFVLDSGGSESCGGGAGCNHAEAAASEREGGAPSGSSAAQLSVQLVIDRSPPLGSVGLTAAIAEHRPQLASRLLTHGAQTDLEAPRRFSDSYG